MKYCYFGEKKKRFLRCRLKKKLGLKLTELPWQQRLLSCILLTISIRASKESDMHQLGFGQGESITLEVYLKEVNLGHSSVGNQEIVEHNYKFEHEEYLC